MKPQVFETVFEPHVGHEDSDPRSLRGDSKFENAARGAATRKARSTYLSNTFTQLRTQYVNTK